MIANQRLICLEMISPRVPFGMSGAGLGVALPRGATDDEN